MDSGNKWEVQCNSETIFGAKKMRGQITPAAYSLRIFCHYVGEKL